MDRAEFQGWLDQASRLTRSQRRKVIACVSEDLPKPPDQESRHLKIAAAGEERELKHLFSVDPICPSCRAPDAYQWGVRHGLQRYRCRMCKHTFNALSGTSLAGLQKKEQWLTYANCLKQSCTLHECAKLCKVDFKTAFRWRHRFMTLVSEDQAEDLVGIVEAGETFFRESRKGKRHIPRPSHERGTPAPQRGEPKEWIKAVTLRDRTGATHELILRDSRVAELMSAMAFNLRPDAVLCSGGSPVYTKLAKALNLHHESVNANTGERPRSAFHIQNANAYQCRLKSWIARFHGVSTDYLPNYLGWHRLLDGHQESLTPSKLIRIAIGKERFQPISPS